MPTYELSKRFATEYARLTPDQRAAFRQARVLFVRGIVNDRRFHPRLRVKRFQQIPGVYELAWAADGRALWRYGRPVPGRSGPHIVWLRIGTHTIYEER